jgi:hypothetical protein
MVGQNADTLRETYYADKDISQFARPWHKTQLRVLSTAWRHEDGICMAGTLFKVRVPFIFESKLQYICVQWAIMYMIYKIQCAELN